MGCGAVFFPACRSDQHRLRSEQSTGYHDNQ